MFSKDLKIAITGGAGYIGSFTTKYLKDLGFNNLVILDNFSTGHKSACFTRYIEVDLLDKEKLNEVFKTEKFDAVIHFAGLIVVPESMTNPYEYFNTNMLSSLNLLEAMKKNNTKNIVFSSTCAVYGLPEKTPISEDEIIKPQSVYAESKAMIETLIKWYSQLFKINYAILRYFNACGAEEDGSNGEMHNPETHLIPCAIKKLMEKQPIEIYGTDYPTKDGTCVRDYIHVKDLASAHHLALKHIVENNTSDLFNLGTGNGFSNKEVVSSILETAKQYGYSSEEIVYKERRAGDVPTLFANNNKAKKILGWDPQYLDVKKIVETAFKWHLKEK